jgi:hypothetical protein
MRSLRRNCSPPHTTPGACHPSNVLEEHMSEAALPCPTLPVRHLWPTPSASGHCPAEGEGEGEEDDPELLEPAVTQAALARTHLWACEEEAPAVSFGAANAPETGSDGGRGPRTGTGAPGGIGGSAAGGSGAGGSGAGGGGAAGATPSLGPSHSPTGLPTSSPSPYTTTLASGDIRSITSSGTTLFVSTPVGICKARCVCAHALAPLSRPPLPPSPPCPTTLQVLPF